MDVLHLRESTLLYRVLLVYVVYAVDIATSLGMGLREHFSIDSTPILCQTFDRGFSVNMLVMITYAPFIHLLGSESHLVEILLERANVAAISSELLVQGFPPE